MLEELFFGKVVVTFAAKVLIHIGLYVHQSHKKMGEELGLLLNHAGVIGYWVSLPAPIL